MIKILAIVLSFLTGACGQLKAVDKPISNSSLGLSSNLPPAIPTMLTASSISSAQIDLSWTDNSVDETSFLIERALAVGGPYSPIFSPAAGSTHYSNSGLMANTTYYYRVSSINTGGASAPSSTASATTKVASTTPPSAPSMAVATAQSTTSIKVSWKDNSTSETGFRVERSSNGGTTYTTAGSVAANALTFTDTGLTAATAYSYRVFATSPAGDSSASNVVSATTMAVVVKGYAYLNTAIFAPKCTACHSGPTPSKGIKLDVYAEVKAHVVAGDAAASPAYAVIMNKIMPPGQPNAISAADLAIFKAWIESGAPNN